MPGRGRNQSWTDLKRSVSRLSRVNREQQETIDNERLRARRYQTQNAEMRLTISQVAEILGDHLEDLDEAIDRQTLRECYERLQEHLHPAYLPRCDSDAPVELIHTLGGRYQRGK